MSQKLVLGLNGCDVERAYGLIRQYAIATQDILIGPRIWAVHGIDAVRRLFLLSNSHPQINPQIYLDARLYGTPDELGDIVTAMAKEHVRGVTVAASSGTPAMRRAVESARQVVTRQGFMVIGYGVPDPMVCRRRSDAYRDSRMHRMLYAAGLAGIDAYMAQAIDWHMSKELLPKMPLVMHAERHALEHRRECGKSFEDWFRAGAEMVIYDPAVVCKRCNLEDDAEALRKQWEMFRAKCVVDGPARRVRRALKNRDQMA